MHACNCISTPGMPCLASLALSSVCVFADIVCAPRLPVQGLHRLVAALPRFSLERHVWRQPRRTRTSLSGSALAARYRSGSPSARRFYFAYFALGNVDPGSRCARLGIPEQGGSVFVSSCPMLQIVDWASHAPNSGLGFSSHPALPPLF